MELNPSHPVIIGKVTGVFGVKGWLKIRSETEPRENILQYSPWYLKIDNQWHRFTVQTGQVHGKGLIAQLEGCSDRDRAAELVGAEINIESAQLPELAENEYYWSDLLGLEVQNQQDQILGKITSIMPTGANDVLVIEDGTKQILIPYALEQYILQIDLARGMMRVDWPWLDENEAEDANESE